MNGLNTSATWQALAAKSAEFKARFSLNALFAQEGLCQFFSGAGRPAARLF